MSVYYDLSYRSNNCTAAALPNCRYRFPAWGSEGGSAAPREEIVWIVLAAEPITDVDTTAADMLTALDEELNAQGTSLVWAELKDPVRVKIDRYGLTGTLAPEHFFPTVDDAVAAYRRQTGAAWVSTDDGSSIEGDVQPGPPR